MEKIEKNNKKQVNIFALEWKKMKEKKESEKHMKKMNNNNYSSHLIERQRFSPSLQYISFLDQG